MPAVALGRRRPRRKRRMLKMGRPAVGLFWVHGIGRHRGITQQLYRGAERPNSSGKPHFFTFGIHDRVSGYVRLDIWQEALEERMRENNAQARYQEARERLFDAFPPQP